MFIKRDIKDQIVSGSKQVPVIAIIGPRQSGKSTLAKEIFKNHIYLDMQDYDIFEHANTDPKDFLQSYENEYGLIIDEAQYVPKLFSQIKVEADKNPRKGYFVLSGSQNFLLHEKISESLAGRVYFYNLLPLSIKELSQSNLVEKSIQEQLIKGFYPRVYQDNINLHDYYQNYISTYVERDIRAIRNIDNILNFQKFMQLCALRIGTTINITDLSTNCGISLSTAKSWLGLLETSFILFQLPSYHDNLGKRVTKSSKIYFYDTGLAASLMEFDKDLILTKRDIYGALFENMVVVDLIKNIYANGQRPNLYYYRDTNQKEVDLILERKATVTPIEIKASQTLDSKFFETITWFKNEVKSDQEPIVIYGGERNQNRSLGKVISWKKISDII